VSVVWLCAYVCVCVCVCLCLLIVYVLCVCVCGYCDQFVAYCFIALIVHPPAGTPVKSQWVDAPNLKRQGTPRARPSQRTNPRATDPTESNRRHAQRERPAQRTNQRPSFFSRCLMRLLRHCRCCCWCSSVQGKTLICPNAPMSQCPMPLATCLLSCHPVF